MPILKVWDEETQKYIGIPAIKGETGETGEKGDTGPQGPQGEPGISTKVNGISPDETGNVTLTAADVGAVPVSGGAMTGALSVLDPTESAHAASKGYVDTAKAEAISHANTVVRKAAPRNLLDNSNFRNPVNQRGKTTDNATDWAYGIDRWIFGNVTYKLATNGITLTPYGSGGEHLIAQYLEKQDFLIGKKITFAVGLSNGNVCIATGIVPKKSDWAQIAQAEFSGVILSVMWSGGTNYLMPRILVEQKTTVAWAALYEGEYTAETLPEYHPKGYGAELAECQRYYYRNWDGDMSIMLLAGVFAPIACRTTSIVFPVTMREKPSITLYNPISGNKNCISDWETDADVSVDTVYVTKHHFMITGNVDASKMYSYLYEATADL